MKNTFKTIITAGLLITGVANAAEVLCENWKGPSLTDSSKIVEHKGSMFKLHMASENVINIEDAYGEMVVLRHLGPYNKSGGGMYTGKNVLHDTYTGYAIFDRSDVSFDIYEFTALGNNTTTCYIN